METLDRDENMEAVNEKEPDQWMDRKIVLLGISEIQANTFFCISINNVI